MKRLEIQGFKSFPEKTVFKFQEDGLTGVVGPNGCGKSNIVDAVRWTLGEQSAKLLRGQAMEDVIFNGSDRRKAAGMAEVTLTFENDGSLENQWRDYGEISVSRRLFRTGESDYLINGVECRLKDVRELIADAGGSSRGYSIVEQGRVSLMVNSKPEEKRALIEEAAGVLKYRMRRLEAERKLDRTRQNLLRIGDVLREVHRQLSSMKRSAAKARRYRAVRKELEDIVLRSRFEEYTANLVVLSGLEKEKTDLSDEITGLGSRLSTLDARETRIRGDLAAGEEEITAGFEEVRSIEGEIARLEGDISVREGAVLSLEDRVRRLSEDKEHLALRSEREEQELKQLELDLEGIEGQHEERVSRLKVLEDEFAVLEKERAAGKERLESLRNELFSMGNEGSRLEMLIETSGRSAEALAKRIHESRARKMILEEKAAAVRETAQARESRNAEAVAKSEELSARVKNLRESAREKREQLAETETRLADLSGRLAELRGLHRTLVALEERMEGLPEGVRSVMTGLGQSSQQGVVGVVADYMEVPREYEKAVMAVLGERLDHVIVESPESGRAAVDYLKEKTAGRGSFIPLKPRANGDVSLRDVAGNGILGALSNLVSFSRELNGLGDFLLGGALLVEDLETALRLWKRNGIKATLVTLDGDVIDPAGVISGGIQNLEESPLARKRKLRELQSACEKAQRELEREREKRDLLKDLIGNVQGELESLEEEARDLDKEVASSASGLAVSAEELRNIELAMVDLDAGIDFFERESVDLEKSATDAKARLEILKAREEKTRGDIAEVEAALTDLTARLEEHRKNLEDHRLEVNTVHLRRVNSQRAIDAAKERNRESGDRRARIEKEINEALAAIDDHRLQIQKGRETIRGSVGRLEGKRESLSALRARQDEARRTAESLAQEARQARTVLDERRAALSRVEIRIHELLGENQHIRVRVAEEHQRDIDAVAAGEFGTEAFDREEADRRISALREKIAHLGEVNPGAVEEYDELQARFSSLDGQKKDLEESIASLQQAIRKINRTSKERFVATFEEVSRNFSELFPRLINGGSAEMVLLDESDPLNTGVDIHVRLPGKRLRNMQLLSGGEKAIISLTMILSLFLVKPSPVCILDEVDAPLDDENLGNFAQIIREMSSSFQFLIITHNKLTMEAVDVLYGITMREPGVSQVVSVRLKDVA